LKCWHQPRTRRDQFDGRAVRRNQEAEVEMGLVTWVCEPDALEAFVENITDRLCSGPPIALAQTKALLNASFDLAHQHALEAEARAQAVNSATEDATAARQAFLERREPVFTGKWLIRSEGNA
jgi:enoyl-CoA hydratase/carnithine racemase